MELVPDLPDAHSFHLFGTPAGAKARFAPSHELIHHSFEDLRRSGAGGAGGAARQGGREVQS